jgi:hypothetical protein
MSRGACRFFICYQGGHYTAKATVLKPSRILAINYKIQF